MNTRSRSTSRSSTFANMHTLLISVAICCLTVVLGNVTNPSRISAQELSPQSAAGDLDSMFGSGGKTTLSFADRDDLFGLALQSDGKIIVAGIAGSTTDHGLLARYNSNGSLDTSFGAGGEVEVGFFGMDDDLVAIELQPDGGIVGAGAATVDSASGVKDFALVRCQPDGRLDRRFSQIQAQGESFGADWCSPAWLLGL